VPLKCKKKDRISVYIPKETVLKEMTAKIEQTKPACLFLPSPGTFQYFSYMLKLKVHCYLHTGRFFFKEIKMPYVTYDLYDFHIIVIYLYVVLFHVKFGVC
jgi:hypothetical protein